MRMIQRRSVSQPHTSMCPAATAGGGGSRGVPRVHVSLLPTHHVGLLLVAVLLCESTTFCTALAAVRPTVVRFHGRPAAALFMPRPALAATVRFAGTTPDQDDLYDDNREKVRVPRGGGRRRRYYDDADDVYDDVPGNDRRSRRAYYDDDDDDDKEEEEQDFDAMYDDELEELEEYDPDMLVPNPIIDSIDPDGAGERFGELARDPKFWLDFAVFVAILNFVDYVAHVPIY